MAVDRKCVGYHRCCAVSTDTREPVLDSQLIGSRYAAHSLTPISKRTAAL